MTKELTKHQVKLINSAAAILTDNPTPEDYAFLARQLVQATLPHTDPGNVEVWMRQDGAARLMIRRGYDLETGKPYGLPFGSIPRLLLYWITTEAIRTKSRDLKLGRSLNDFMRELGLNPATGGGKRGDAARVRNQMLRLFSAAITFGEVAHDEHGGHGVRRMDMQVATRQQLWWNLKSPEERSLWENEITLGEDFYRAITAAPIPLDIRALAGLKRSPLALDLYAWCAYNAHRARQTGAPRWISWEKLAQALGADYGRTKDFQQKARKELRKVQVHFPGLRLGKKRGCLEVLPTSTPPIAPKALVDKSGD
jgi:hypothetical protein